MKKIILLMFSMVLLSACSNNNKNNVSNTNSEKTSVTTTTKTNNTNSNKNLSTTYTSDIRNNKKSSSNIQTSNVKNNKETSHNTSQNTQNNESIQQNKQWIEIKEVKKKYVKRLNALKDLGTDKMKELRVLAFANCTWVCDLDIANQLSETKLKIAKACYKSCIDRQKKAKEQLVKIKQQLEFEKLRYPKKCFEDAKKEYEKNQKEMLKDVWTWDTQMSKEKIIEMSANHCILIYWFSNHDCEKIKDYKKPYEECKRLMKLDDDLMFIRYREYKTFDDYLKDAKY